MSRGLSLYRALLREHRNRLPPQMRSLGNSYLRNEFNLHRSAKDEHLGPFFKEWEDYLETLRRRSGTYGSNMRDSDIEGLSEDQKKQLAQLAEEAQKAGEQK